jgi:hypothetical protein
MDERLSIVNLYQLDLEFNGSPTKSSVSYFVDINKYEQTDYKIHIVYSA